MEDVTRRYILRILGLHVLLLLVVAAVTIFGAYRVYQTAEMRAEVDAGERQRLLARQTAKGIEDFFAGVADNLDLLRRLDETAEVRGIAGGGELGGDAAQLGRTVEVVPALWAQLRDRAEALIVCDVQADEVTAVYPPERDAEARRVLAAVEAEAAAGLGRPLGTEVVRDPLGPVTDDELAAAGSGVVRVSRPVALDDRRLATLVTAPAGGPGSRYHLIAVVSLEELRERFMTDYDRDDAGSALLIGRDLRVLSAADATLTGRDVGLVLQNTPMLGPITEGIEAGVQRSVFVRDAKALDGTPLEESVVTLQPVMVPGRRWTLAVQEPLAGVRALVDETFWGSIRWASFVIIAATAVLLSTGVSAIRGRRRLERLRAEMVERELKGLDEELEGARKIQLNWLPEPWDASHRLEIEAVNTPASRISGDFYDWFPLDGPGGSGDEGRVVVTIGDVTGHGMAAAFLMATTQLLVRSTMQKLAVDGGGGADPGRCLTEVNQQLARQVYGGQFVTLLACVIDLDTRTIEMACAGHQPPLACASRGYEELPVESGLVLGVDEDQTYETARHALPPGCRSMLLYTDGVVEAANPDGDRFSTKELAGELPCDPVSAAHLAQATTRAVSDFAQGVPFDDDLTFVAIYLRPDEDAPEVREVAAEPERRAG